LNGIQAFAVHLAQNNLQRVVSGAIYLTTAHEAQAAPTFKHDSRFDCTRKGSVQGHSIAHCNTRWLVIGSKDRTMTSFIAFQRSEMAP